jgi:xylulokinase
MSEYILAYDLGTGGNKSSLYNEEGTCLAESFTSYPTLYPRSGWHEQRPEDWWDAIVKSTHDLLSLSNIDPQKIICIGISGQSLGVVPIGHSGELLRPTTPIWSDSRAQNEAKEFFQHISEDKWYQVTGNGFPAALYAVFKIMWYQKYEPEMFFHIDKVVGSKDYINYKLTDTLVTDFSYASGSGVYNLLRWNYDDQLIQASDLPRKLFPEIVPSTQIIGTLTKSAAEVLGLTQETKVVSGGVDNSCMALGARNTREGRVYNSQGSSSWIAVTSSKPLIDSKVRPFVFTHVLPGLFTSAVSTFSAGTSFRWVKDEFCRDLIAMAEMKGLDPYDLMTEEAEKSPVGASGLLFNPNMAGGTSMSKSVNIRGAFIGLDLRHTRSDIIRSVMEGIALELRVALDALRSMEKLDDTILLVGGGSRSAVWRRIYANAYDSKVLKTNIDQQAAALGAVACAAVGTKLWESFDFVDEIHKIEDIIEPDRANVHVYEKILPVYQQAGIFLSDLGDRMTAEGLQK